MNNNITKNQYDAEDNELNTAEKELILHYCERHNETIENLYVFKYHVTAYTKSGRELIAKTSSVAYTTKRIANYLYINEIINGKEKRIKKSEY